MTRNWEAGFKAGKEARDAELIKVVSERKKELIDYYGESAQVAPRLNELKWFLELIKEKT